MFGEAFRVLCPGGIFRCCCPDAEFLYNITSAGKDYWEWRRSWFEQKGYLWNDVSALDCLVEEVSTPKLRRLNRDELYENYTKLEMRDFFEWLIKDNSFESVNVDNHINYWDAEKMVMFLR